MAEYIDREVLKEHLNNCIASGLYDKDMKIAICGIAIFVKNMPAADVQPVKRGRWIKAQDKRGDYFLCSNCGTVEKTESGQDGAVWWHDEYCRKCGADMRNKEE